jgi:hypothetical protein
MFIRLTLSVESLDVTTTFIARFASPDCQMCLQMFALPYVDDDFVSDLWGRSKPQDSTQMTRIFS